MPTIRGFVERLEVGRAGLVTASVMKDDASVANYVIKDLDADPERFNERLSKLGILRDAMNGAEPVEIEYTDEGGSHLIDRVARITRDTLAAAGDTERVSALVVGVAVMADNHTGSHAETSDRASVAVMSDTGALVMYTLDLQIPERAVAMAQLEMIRQAQESGEPLTFVVYRTSQRIVAVEAGNPSPVEAGARSDLVDGFVEFVIVAPGLAPMGLSIIGFTTAPAFTGAGNLVELKPFVPTLRRFLVVQGSLEYDLFVAGLRDKLRMRVLAGQEVKGRGTESQPKETGDTQTTNDDKTGGVRVNAFAQGAPSAASAQGMQGQGVKLYSMTSGELTLVRGTELLAPLASASRPVWIQISRQSLDDGPEGETCTEGLPSSDLRPKGLRDLQIPYTAEWVGIGCFNHGVYRFQFELAGRFEVSIDCKEVCVHASDDGKARFAHACLDGEHVVRVVLHHWTCSDVFRMDVYRIR